MRSRSLSLQLYWIASLWYKSPNLNVIFLILKRLHSPAFRSLEIARLKISKSRQLSTTIIFVYSVSYRNSSSFWKFFFLLLFLHFFFFYIKVKSNPIIVCWTLSVCSGYIFFKSTVLWECRMEPKKNVLNLFHSEEQKKLQYTSEFTLGYKNVLAKWTGLGSECSEARSISELRIFFAR